MCNPKYGLMGGHNVGKYLEEHGRENCLPEEMEKENATRILNCHESEIGALPKKLQAVRRQNITFCCKFCVQ